MARSTIVFVTGAPAAGKTTLLSRLPHDLGIGYIAKDDLKELLFDTLGPPADKPESRVYGKAVIQAQFLIASYLADAGKSFIFEAALMPQFANADLAPLVVSGAKLVQIHCYVSPELRFERAKQRILSGNRHAAHADPVDGTLEEHAKLGEQYGPLDIAATREVDMTEFTEDMYAELLAWLKGEISDK